MWFAKDECHYRDQETKGAIIKAICSTDYSIHGHKSLLSSPWKQTTVHNRCQCSVKLRGGHLQYKLNMWNKKSRLLNVSSKAKRQRLECFYILTISFDVPLMVGRQRRKAFLVQFQASGTLIASSLHLS